MNKHADRPKPSAEYVALVSFLISVGALATDIMLPALRVISDDLGAPHKTMLTTW